MVLESLDELEVALLSSNQRTDCNHIFLNFAPTVIFDPHKIAKDVEENIILRYAKRFLKLKVKYAEIRMSVRWPPTGLATNSISFAFLRNNQTCLEGKFSRTIVLLAQVTSSNFNLSPSWTL